MNIAMLLDMAAEGMADRPAVGSRTDGITYGQLNERSGQAASLISASETQRVGFVGSNSNVLPLLLFASARAGVPFVPINYRLADDRLSTLLSKIAPAMVVSDEDDRIGGVEGLDVRGCHRFEAEIEGLPAEEHAHTDPDAVAVWLFTSGTTGEPKAALLRHRHVVSYVLTTLEFMSSEEHEATLVSVPPYHIAGVAAILSSIYTGRRIVYLPQFDADEWVELARREQVTHAMVVPTMLSRILDVLDDTAVALPHLSHLSYGGGRMPRAVIDRAMALLPDVGFTNAYGLTETSSTIAVLGPEDHREAFSSRDPAVRARLASVGRPLPALELEIRDEEGRRLPSGHGGEIYVRGEQIAGEYENGTRLSDDGWFATNDAGFLDDGGFLFVEGRLDDVIVRGGENISPGEIESVLVEHPAVREAAVVGVPDDEWGECPAAAVVLERDSGVEPLELQRWVRSRVRSTRTPVALAFRQELPHNETGKLLRRVLREELAQAPRLP